MCFWPQFESEGFWNSEVAYLYGIRGIPFTWLTSYLAHREQYDMVYHHDDVSSINNVFEFRQDSLLWLSPLFLFKSPLINPLCI